MSLSPQHIIFEEDHIQQAINYGYKPYYQPELVFISDESSQLFKNIYLPLTETNQTIISHLLLFIVNQKTKETIKSIGILTIGSSTIGNGIELAKLIKERYDALQIKDKKLLFLIGDKYSADLSSYLDKNSINIKTIMVHKTVTCQLSAYLLNLLKEVGNELNWIVLLLPAQFSTTDCLSFFGLKVDVIGSGSDLKALMEAIKEYDISNCNIYMSLSSNILFLKEEDELYTQQSISFGYEPYYQSVLQETYENETTLTKLLHNPVDYWGLIFTSKRSSQSFKKVYLSLTEKGQADLNQLLLFSVGQKTSECIQALGLKTIGSDTTGYGIKLAKLVKEKYDTLEIKHKRLLFLTGDKNRVELPNYLIENNIEFEKLRVYKTEPNQQLSLEFSKLLNEVEDNFRWLTFFSPSGVDACLEIFKNEKTKDCKIATIGNTTADYLKKVGIAVHAIALKPEPKALLEAIKEFDVKN